METYHSVPSIVFSAYDFIFAHLIRHHLRGTTTGRINKPWLKVVVRHYVTRASLGC